MLLETLQIYCDVVESNSFSKGAAKNGVTQSRASQSVHKLEDQFGVNLIDRSYRPWRLTEAGRLCYEECLYILEKYDSLERKLKNLSDTKPNTLKMASIYSAGFSYLTNLQELYDDLYEEDVIDVEYLHPKQILENVANDTLDLGVVSFPKESNLVTVLEWKQERMVLAVSPDHPLAVKESIDVELLKGKRMVAFNHDLIIGQEIESFLSNNGVKVKTMMRFDNIEAIKRSIEGSNYIALLPEPTLEREVKNGSLKAIPFTNQDFYRPLGIIYRKDREISEPMQKFISLAMR